MNPHRSPGFTLLAAFVLGVYVASFAASAAYAYRHADQVLVMDVGRLAPTYVREVVEEDEVAGLQEVLAEAREQGLHVSIAGKRHSMGGHAFYPDAVVLDMTSFDDVLGVDVANRTVTVQSGATWAAVFDAIDPHDLSVGVMQAYNGFTIGGSMSVNVHESDPNFGPLVETVESFRLLLANGTVVHVDREAQPELFRLVIGGYGLFGVILDATLRLVPNTVLAKSEQVITYDQYPATFRAIVGDPLGSGLDGVEHGAGGARDMGLGPQAGKVGQVFARLSIAPGESLLREMVVTTYRETGEDLGPHRGLQEPSVATKKFVFGLSRLTDWGKDVRWWLQKEHSDLVDDPVISRNNLMNGDVSFLSYASATHTDILQEYFVPFERLPAFVDDLRAVVEREDLNLLSATIRYVPANNESMLSYARTESFGVVLYFNVGTSDEDQAVVQAWTRELLDASLAKGGTYYLPYVAYASREQMRAAYPGADAFFAAKDRYDPTHLFLNRFHEDYA